MLFPQGINCALPQVFLDILRSFTPRSSLVSRALGTSSFHLHIFLCILPKRNFVPEQVIADWAHSDFQSDWNSRSGTKFNSGIMKTETGDSFRIETGKSCSLHSQPQCLRFWFRFSLAVMHRRALGSRLVYFGASDACVSDLAQKPRGRERLRLSRSILLCECNTNFTLERNYFRTERHSGII